MQTQLCLQLAVNCSIPAHFGGVEGEAVYVDTEGSFMAGRARDIAVGLALHVERLQKRKAAAAAATAVVATEGTAATSASASTSPLPTVESMLRGLHVFRVFDHVEQLAVLRALPSFLRERPRVRLVLIDSIAFHFRRGFDGDFSTRARMLAAMAQQLQRLAHDHRVAVVAVNQVTTRIAQQGGAADSNDSGEPLLPSSSSSLAPALGESWSHSCTSRVLLYWKGAERWARIIKSPARKQAACRYTVNAHGIRDVRLSAHTAALTHSGANTAEQQRIVEDKSSPRERASTASPPQKRTHTAAQDEEKDGSDQHSASNSSSGGKRSRLA